MRKEDFVFALARKSKRMINAGEEETKALQVPSEFYPNVKGEAQSVSNGRSFRHQWGVIEQPGIQMVSTLNLAQPMSIADLSEVWLDCRIF